MENSELLYSDHHGVYIPQLFAQECASSFKGINHNDLKVLLEGPEHEWYWEAWDTVLSDSSIVRNGVEYMLHQDGDLWLVKSFSTCQDEINEKVEEYAQSMYEWEQSDDAIGDYFYDLGDMFTYHNDEAKRVLMEDYEVPEKHVEAVINAICDGEIDYQIKYHSQGFPHSVSGAILSVGMTEFEWDVRDFLDELEEEYSFYCSDQSIENVFEIDYLSSCGNYMYYYASYDVISLQCEMVDIEKFIKSLGECDSCEMISINGLNTHEMNCPNS